MIHGMLFYLGMLVAPLGFAIGENIPWRSSDARKVKIDQLVLDALGVSFQDTRGLLIRSLVMEEAVVLRGGGGGVS